MKLVVAVLSPKPIFLSQGLARCTDIILYGEPKTWLNEVRTRAGLAELASVTVDDVLTERHLEFVGEGKRYFDLVRAEGISGASSKNKATTALVPDEYGYRTNSWTAKKKYIPIAQSELDSDPALVQNAYK